jgi:hypothetical protein
MRYFSDVSLILNQTDIIFTSQNAMDETAIYDFSSVSKFNRNPEPLTTGHLHNSKKYKSTCKMRNEIETKRSEINRNEIHRNEAKSKRNSPKHFDFVSFR